MAKQGTRGSRVVQRVEVPTLDLTVTEAAWAQWEARVRAVPAKGLNAARLDLTVAAAVARAGAANVLAARAQLEEEFTRPDLAAVSALEGLSYAVQHADLLYRASVDEVAPYVDLLPRVNELRGMLLDDLTAQVRRKRAPEELLATVRAGDNSVGDKANDLNDLAQWYRANWDTLGGRTTVELPEITEAAALGVKLLTRLGATLAGNTPRPGESSPADLRRRAFTLLAQEYQLARRYGAWLFFDAPEGWEAYVPSLWAGRGGRSEKSPSDPEGGGEGEKKPG